MNMIDPILAELAHEAATTRRLLQRLPEAHLTWKPHEKSMTLGRLAGHIAEIPARISSMLEPDEYDFAAGGEAPHTASGVADLLAFFDQSVSQATERLKKQTNDRLLATWRLKKGGKQLLEMPRMGAVRFMLLNHLIHHRGQLSVYLRLQNVPVPSIYGPTADEPM
ncbi:MAG: DinB family protein [candidate division NC10 bacterium]|nr:DinB family protein [candidate division NC10 bacterium]